MHVQLTFEFLDIVGTAAIGTWHVGPKPDQMVFLMPPVYGSPETW